MPTILCCLLERNVNEMENCEQYNYTWGQITDLMVEMITNLSDVYSETVQIDELQNDQSQKNLSLIHI